MRFSCRILNSSDLFPLFIEDETHGAREVSWQVTRTNGFVERFNRTVLDEFLRPAFRQRFYTSVKTPQKDLDT